MLKGYTELKADLLKVLFTVEYIINKTVENTDKILTLRYIHNLRQEIHKSNYNFILHLSILFKYNKLANKYDCVLSHIKAVPEGKPIDSAILFEDIQDILVIIGRLFLT